jgi:murein L,D-transpeptidase YafK
MPLSVAANGRRFFGTADSILVEKGAHRLTLFREGLPVVSYRVALGKNPSGHKERAGDFRTPEGLYHIDARNPNSRFHLGLHVSYPNAQDVARARATGVPTGGDIMIHGLPNGQGQVGAAHRQYDWTNGCVAVTDEEIEEIWSSVPVGTPVRIVP